MGRRKSLIPNPLTGAKRKIAAATGIPTTASGRDRKIGRWLSGCGTTVLLFAMVGAAIIGGIVWLVA